MASLTSAPSPRGFTVSHQKVALELGLEDGAVLGGYTEITILPTDRNLRTVYLNSRQCRISAVTCGGHDADFTLRDDLTGVGISDSRDVHLFPSLKRKLYAFASDGQGGELSIALPAAVQSSLAAPGSIDAPTPGGSSVVELAPVVIRIHYTLHDPADGIHRVRPSVEAPWRQPHLYTSPTCPDFSRCWVPCVDSLWERNTWEFDFIVPVKMGGAGVDAQEVVVACTGDLVERVTHPNHSGKLIYSFVQASPTSVHHVAFAAGCFEVIDLSAASAKSAAASSVEGTTAAAATAAVDDANEVQLLAFCLPGREADIPSSCQVARQALDFYSREFGSYPFSSYKLIFVEDAITDVHNAATMGVFSADLLHPASVIDQALETRQVLSHALATQWVGINIIQRTWADTWLINGLNLYIAGLFWRRLMGNNEYRFRLRKDCDRVCAWDVGMPPLCQSGATEPPDSSLLPFINLKAPLVLHILDRRLCKAGASLGLGRVIPKVFLQAITGELPNNSLSTSSFLRTCRKVSGVDLRSFVDQWIYGSGCPRFFISSHFNRKKLTIEIHLRQESPAYQFAQYRPELAAGSNPVKTFDGQMTIRIHEADGRPYEHVLDIKLPQRRFDVPFNTKYKRVRRNTKRFQARQAAAVAAAEGDQDAAEAIGMIDLGFSLALWENEEQRERWKVADWTEDDEDIMSQAAYEWIRMDSEFEWIAQLHVDQPDFMWVSQLQRDRDVVAQLQAVQALAQIPNAISSSMLTRTVLVHKYFYRIRTEACHALVNCASPQLGYLGLFHLLMLFRTSFCIDVANNQAEAPGSSALDMVCIPRANDFSDPAEYFVKRAMVHAISRVRNERGRTLPQVKRLLVNLLRYNDNSTNRFADDYYVAGLISAIASAFVPVESPVFGGFVPANEDPDARDDPVLFQSSCAEVARLQELDKLVPSFHNVVSLACLDWHAAMVLSQQLPLDLAFFLSYTQEGTFTPLRIAAFNHLLILSGLKHRVVVRYLFSVLQTDENRLVKRSLAKAICEGLAIAVALGDVSGAASSRGGAGGDGLVEETSGSDLQAADRAREKEMESSLRSLRKEVGRSAAVREGFLAALLAKDVDSEERWALIKLAELLFKPAEERELPLEQELGAAQAKAASQQQAQGDGGAAISALPKIKLVSRTDAQSPSTPSARVAFEEAPEAPARSKPAPSIKVKKPKPLAQAQAAGMTHADLTACRNALKKLQNNKHALLFINPVDPVRDGAPDYHKVIREPMDLSTMENKLEAGLYADRFAFQKDFELLIRNAKTYTPDPRAFVHKAADALDKAFQALWARTKKTLEQAAAKARGEGDAATATPDGHPSVTPGPVSTAVAPAAMAPPPVPARVATAASPTPPIAPASSSTPKTLGLKLKLKSKAPGSDAPAAATSSPAPAPAPAPRPKPLPPLNGSSNENVSSPATSSPSNSGASTSSPYPTPTGIEPGPDPITPASLTEPIHPKQCRTLLANLRKVPESILFLAPVDANIAPGYYDVVHNPMDLGTIETKLNGKQYSTMADFARDIEQVWANSYIYADLTAVSYAEVLRAQFRKKEWPRAMLRRLDYSEKRALQGLMGKIRAKNEAALFFQPVDEIAAVLPHYFDVVPREKARDLSMVLDKIKASPTLSAAASDAEIAAAAAAGNTSSSYYTSVADVAGDVALMLSNARAFNVGNEAVLAMVADFEKIWQREWKGMMSTLEGAGGGGAAKKRKDGSPGAVAGFKRAKS